jgi:hypothetical protein
LTGPTARPITIPPAKWPPLGPRECNKRPRQGRSRSTSWLHVAEQSLSGSRALREHRAAVPANAPLGSTASGCKSAYSPSPALTR